MYYQRKIFNDVLASFNKGKVVILYGARQIGKTTMAKEIATKFPDFRYISCDLASVQAALVPDSNTRLKEYLGEHSLIILDEAQQVEDIGLTLKILIDHYPTMNILATGSSSFDLANKVGEPLVGRSFEFNMHPISVSELVAAHQRDAMYSFSQELPTRLIYGMYPEVLNAPTTDAAKNVLDGLVSGNLYKDALAYRGIKKPALVLKLLKLLAYQMGSEVSTNELATILEVDRATVASYITLLEQAFIIFTLRPYANNKRLEISRLQKVYFWDVGVRNAMIGAFDDLELRKDKGALFENFFIAEILKQHAIDNINVFSHFWRTKNGQEIDYIEERNGGRDLRAFECKWKYSTAPAPTAWTSAYPEAKYQVVTADSLESVLKQESKK